MSTAVLGLGVVLAALMPVFFRHFSQAEDPNVLHGEEEDIVEDGVLQRSEKEKRDLDLFSPWMTPHRARRRFRCVVRRA